MNLKVTFIPLCFRDAPQPAVSQFVSWHDLTFQRFFNINYIVYIYRKCLLLPIIGAMYQKILNQITEINQK